jgi:hypothetical protein
LASRRAVRRYKSEDARGQAADPQIAAYFADLRREFGPYVVSPAETRRLVDRDMGDVTLTELLHRARGERP